MTSNPFEGILKQALEELSADDFTRVHSVVMGHVMGIQALRNMLAGFLLHFVESEPTDPESDPWRLLTLKFIYRVVELENESRNKVVTN